MPSQPSSHALREILSLLHFPGLISIVMILPGVIVGPIAYWMRDDFPFSKSDIGTTFALFFLCSALAAGRGSSVVARTGAYAVIRVGLLGSAATMFALALAGSREAVYVWTSLAGLLNGITAVAVSVTILSSVPGHRRGFAFGLRTAGLPSAAAVAGLGGWMVAAGILDWRQLLAGVALLAVITAATVHAGAKTDLHENAVDRPQSVSGTRSTLTLLRIGGFFGSVGTAAVTPYFVENLIEHGVTPGRAAAVLAVAGWLGVAMRLAVGAGADTISDPLVHLRASSAFLVVLGSSTVALALGEAQGTLIAATVLACGVGFAWPGLWMYASLLTHRERPTRVAGQLALGQHAGAVVGPLAFSAVLVLATFDAAWLGAGAVIAASAGLIFGAARVLARPVG